MPITAAQRMDLIAGLWYINILTDANPMGELRGQVVGFEDALVMAPPVDQPEVTNTNPPGGVDEQGNGAVSKSYSSLLVLVFVAAVLLAN